MTRARRTLAFFAIAASMAALGAACSDNRSTLAPAGPAARILSEIGRPVLIGFTGVSLLMWGLLVWVAWRRTGTVAEHAPISETGGMPWVVIGGFVVPATVFTAIYVATLGVMNAFPMNHGKTVAPEIRVTCHQWWWEVQYLMGGGPNYFKTANEIHIPTNRPVEIELASADVIHSFWVPRLHGKVDMIPGTVNRIRLQADEAGVFPGACAEFCGLQHAKMRFVVVAEAPDVFERWRSLQRKPAPLLSDAAAIRGEKVFMNGPCPVCHKVAGTLALATVGPDLTHVATRATLASGWLPKDVATLHAWIINAPSLKEGVQMPPFTQFGGPQLHDLVAYLEALQ